jgi:hypothetical protein
MRILVFGADREFFLCMTNDRRYTSPFYLAIKIPVHLFWLVLRLWLLLLLMLMILTMP